MSSKHLAPGLTPPRRSLWLMLGCCALVSGCHHRQAAPTLPRVVQAPTTQPPIPAAPVMEGPPPATITTAPPVKVTQAKPVRKPRRTTIRHSTAPANPEVASAATAPAISPIGALSSGDEADPRKQQSAAELIASGERRLEALNAAKTPAPQSQIKEIRHFLDGAKEALASGDVQGANTLATKARLLLDDLEKATQR